MREPSGPFLELGFYYADVAERVAFRHLLLEAEARGALFTGTAYGHRAAGIRDRRFSDIHELPLEPLAVRNRGDLERWLEDPDTRLLQVFMSRVTGTAEGTAEAVSYLSISADASLVDHHPLAIWTDGTLFSGPLRQVHQDRGQRTG
jgi:hypothetical protein